MNKVCKSTLYNYRDAALVSQLLNSTFNRLFAQFNLTKVIATYAPYEDSYSAFGRVRNRPKCQLVGKPGLRPYRLHTDSKRPRCAQPLDPSTKPTPKGGVRMKVSQSEIVACRLMRSEMVNNDKRNNKQINERKNERKDKRTKEKMK